jgi:hypothetical protein
MEIIKKVINIFLWIWSHCPVLCLSDDDDFATLNFDNIRNAHLRFSLLNIMLGDSVIYVFSYDIKERKISFIKNLRLIDIDGNVLEDEKMQAEFEAEQYDIVVANILADVIIPIAGIVDRFLKPGGVFISSGIIYMKEEEVKDAINNNSNLQLSKVVNQGDWRAIMAIKK